MHTLRHLTLLLTCAMLGTLPVAQAQASRSGNSSSASSSYDNVKDSQLRKELRALDEAAALLAEVNDEKSAKAAYSKIQSHFRNLPPYLKGNAQELNMLAAAQNRVSAHMWRLMSQPFFETAKLQEAWTLMTDPFSRPCAK